MWMVDASDALVAYGLHDWGRATVTLRHAKQKGRRTISYKDTDQPQAHSPITEEYKCQLASE